MQQDGAGRETHHVRPPITFPNLFNTVGNPNPSVPLRWRRSGRPIGVESVGDVGDARKDDYLSTMKSKSHPSSACSTLRWNSPA